MGEIHDQEDIKAVANILDNAYRDSQRLRRWSLFVGSAWVLLVLSLMAAFAYSFRQYYATWMAINSTRSEMEGFKSTAQASFEKINADAKASYNEISKSQLELSSRLKELTDGIKTTQQAADDLTKKIAKLEERFVQFYPLDHKRFVVLICPPKLSSQEEKTINEQVKDRKDVIVFVGRNRSELQKERYWTLVEDIKKTVEIDGRVEIVGTWLEWADAPEKFGMWSSVVLQTPVAGATELKMQAVYDTAPSVHAQIKVHVLLRRVPLDSGDGREAVPAKS
jgi:glycosyltransferase involved in cell wall biosynthesis